MEEQSKKEKVKASSVPSVSSLITEGSPSVPTLRRESNENHVLPPLLFNGMNSPIPGIYRISTSSKSDSHAGERPVEEQISREAAPEGTFSTIQAENIKGQPRQGESVVLGDGDPKPVPATTSRSSANSLSDVGSLSNILNSPESRDASQYSHSEQCFSVDESSDSPTKGSSSLSKRYFCRVCNQGFTRKHNMVSHELIHSSLKPHICTVCTLKFRRIHDLKRHEKLHTGEKPFECVRCLRKFARSDALTRHLSSPNACFAVSSVNEVVNSEHRNSSEGAEASTPPAELHMEQARAMFPSTTNGAFHLSQENSKEQLNEEQNKVQAQHQPRHSEEPTQNDQHSKSDKRHPPEDSTAKDKSPKLRLLQTPNKMESIQSLTNVSAKDRESTERPARVSPPVDDVKFVSVARYQELLGYASSLQESMKNLTNRIQVLENNAVGPRSPFGKQDTSVDWTRDMRDLQSDARDEEDQTRGREYRERQDYADRALGRRLREEAEENEQELYDKTTSSEANSGEPPSARWNTAPSWQKRKSDGSA